MRGEEWNCWSENSQKARRSPGNNVEAARLENAVWRLWNKGRLDAQNCSDNDEATAKDNARHLDALVRRGSKDSLGSEDTPPRNSIPRLGSRASLAAMAAAAEELEEKGGIDDEEGSENPFLKQLQGALGQRVDFATARFPARTANCRYDDLPTFPIRPNFAGFDNALRPASECVVFDGCPEDPYHPSNTPIYQTATFVQPSCSEFGAYDYTRSGNPTRTALEKHAAMLETAAAAFAFASGMAALHTVMRLLKAGDEIIVNEDIYGGMHRLCTQDCIHNGIKVVFGDTTKIKSIEKLITPQTRLIHTESPSNPRMRITDLRALAKIAHAHGVLLCVDSTMMPPVICKPLTLGADIVVHSATKFFSGHADCTGGLVCVKDPQVAHRIAFLQNAEGTALAPFECFLFLRGIKTMHLRVSKAQENAEQVGAFLLQHPLVKSVLFPGKGGCDAESLAIHRSQALGQGSMISLTTGSVEFSRRFCDACRIFKTTVSFGSVNSLCEMPCTMSHASIPAEERTLPQDLVRLSIGIEDPRDLIADIGRALDIANSAPPNSQREGPIDWYDSKFEDLPVLPPPPPSTSKPQPLSAPPVVAWTERNVEPSTMEPASAATTSDTGSTRTFCEEADMMRHSVRPGHSIAAAAAAGAAAAVATYIVIAASSAARRPR